jgi:hypothetical protein
MPKRVMCQCGHNKNEHGKVLCYGVSNRKTCDCTEFTEKHWRDLCERPASLDPTAQLAGVGTGDNRPATQADHGPRGAIRTRARRRLLQTGRIPRAGFGGPFKWLLGYARPRPQNLESARHPGSG